MNAVSEIVNAIYGLSTRDELNAVIDAVKAKSSMLKQVASAAFAPGTKVYFMHKRSMVTGTVVKANRTTVNVKDDIGRDWRCSPSLLTKMA